MAEKTISPYGSWKSPLTSDLIVSAAVGLSQPYIHGDNLCWIEMRPSEGGRNVIACRDANGRFEDLLPQPFNARTRVHEYGGGDYVLQGDLVFFSNFKDQRLYRLQKGAAPEPITHEGDLRFADPIIDERRNQLICVQEDHSAPQREPVNSIVRVPTDGSGGSEVLVAGNDFYATPRLSPDGSQLAWLTWNHPNMPWDGCELWLGQIDSNGKLSSARCVAGSDGESIFQPTWSPEGTLYFVSDSSGWWNLNLLRDDGKAEALHERHAEFARPQWLFGMSSFAFVSATKIVCTYIEQGQSRLAMLETTTRAVSEIPNGYSDIQYLRGADGQVVFRAGSPKEPIAIVRFDTESGQLETVRQAMNVEIPAGYVSTPEAVEFPTENGLRAHAFFYAPTNEDYEALPGERPPLLVMSHGGPTSAAPAALSLTIQYFTSRGIAVVDVNYGGSTGYGREYRERLKGNWGVVDLDDCVNAARFLADRGSVDAARLMITGGSAGGYTTLCALTFRDTFKAGASHFGVSDLEALAKDTHKFESRYLDGMVGPYPERQDLYVARSPIHFTQHLSRPTIFFQGLEDKVVPPDQAEKMVDALRAKKVPVAYVAFAGEQHGFRKAENIKRALDGELYFYSRVFGFPLAEKVDPIEIENL